MDGNPYSSASRVPVRVYLSGEACEPVTVDVPLWLLYRYSRFWDSLAEEERCLMMRILPGRRLAIRKPV